MSPAKPVGTYRIALLGGSVTYENDTPMKQTFGAYLEEYAGGIFPDRRIEILNAAVGGYNSADGFARFHFKVLDYSPDMVLINFDVNDIWPRAFAKEFTNDYRNARIIMSQRHNPTPTELKWLRRSAFLRVLYFRYVLKGALPNIMEMTYVSSNTALYMENFKRSSSSAFRRNIEDMVYIAKGRGITPVLVTTPLHATMYKPDDPYYVLVLGGREHNEVVRDIAQKENVTLIDLEKMIPGNSTYLGDVCHLTWRGNRLRAKLIADALAPFLEKQFGATAQPYPWPIEELNAPPPAVLKR
jgi:lysophospholipase L1-like esterase